MEPKLPPELLGPMYGLVIQNNLNPVGVRHGISVVVCVLMKCVAMV